MYDYATVFLPTANDRNFGFGFFFSALLYMILVLMDKRFSVNVLK